MSYQQTSSPNTETTFPRSSSGAMYNPQSSRTHAPENQPRAASYTHNPGGGAQNDNVPMNNIMNQFAGLQLPSNAAAMAANQIPMHGQMFYTPDGQLVYAPNMYSAPSMPSVTEGAYSSYPGAMSYLPPAYHSYGVPNYPSVPYTPARAAPYYTGGSDHLTKDVPGLENRRGSYSTNESAPNTPYYGALAQRDHGTHIAPLDRSPFGSTPSPRDLALHAKVSKPLSYTSIPVGVDIQALLKQFPPIPPAVPAVFTPEENKRTLDQSLHNPIKGNRNVYIRGLHPNTNDETLALYATRFGKVETSKAIIDTATEACKGFGFAKYFDVRDSELCIRGFWELGYEVGFARESFNSRLKAEGDEASTNLYVSNLPKNMTEAELGAIFMGYSVSSSRILRDSQNKSRGVGFARFENRDVCEEIIRKFHGQPIGEEGLLLQVRYADTPAQKDLKRITTERRQFRTNEYNVGAYGAIPEGSMGTLSSPMASPLLPRATQIASHFPSRASGPWKRDTTSNNGSVGSITGFKDVDRNVKVSLTEATPNKPKCRSVTVSTPTVSEAGSADDGVTVHCESPAVAHGANTSPSARKA